MSKDSLDSVPHRRRRGGISAGRIGAVKRDAERRYNDGERARWLRRDSDTWIMEIDADKF